MNINHAELVVANVTPLNTYNAMHTENPYEAPDTIPDHPSSVTPLKRERGHGPAIPIVLCTLIGGICGLPFLVQKSAIGFLAVLPGAIAGGIYYRLRSSKWPIDPTAKRRRYIYTVISTLTLPLLTAYATGMRGQGFAMTIVALLLGASIGTGILLSGDRRAGKGE